ncbi:MAG: hypothetical protein AAFQ99_14175, partial [Pseudomonadota bacterium]
GLLAAGIGYWIIFSVEAVLLMVAAILLFGLRPERFQEQAQQVQEQQRADIDTSTGNLGVTSA